MVFLKSYRIDFTNGRSSIKNTPTRKEPRANFATLLLMLNEAAVEEDVMTLALIYWLLRSS